MVCRTHFLPLAKTWLLCRPYSVVGDDSFNVSCREQLVSILRVVYLREKYKFPFSNACALHHIQKGKEVVGRAHSSKTSVFCKDITQFSITEYPLAHNAHKYELTSCFAICLQIPLLRTMKQHFQSFMVASGVELGDELPIEVIDFSKDDKLDSLPQIARSLPDWMENRGEMERQDLSDQ
ncbi:hypothetical protein ACSBR2_013766 [Camellia fascicularis]